MPKPTLQAVDDDPAGDGCKLRSATRIGFDSELSICRHECSRAVSPPFRELWFESLGISPAYKTPQ